MSRKQGEDLFAYSQRIRSQALLAMGDSYQPQHITLRVRDIFLKSLRGDLGNRVRLSFPSTLEAALDMARNLEAMSITERTPVTVNMIERRGQSGGYRGGRGGGFRPTYSGRPTYGPQTSPNTNIRCWECGGAHKKAFCFKLRSPAVQRPTTKKTSHRSGGTRPNLGRGSAATPGRGSGQRGRKKRNYGLPPRPSPPK